MNTARARQNSSKFRLPIRGADRFRSIILSLDSDRNPVYNVNPHELTGTQTLLGRVNRHVQFPTSVNNSSCQHSRIYTSNTSVDTLPDSSYSVTQSKQVETMSQQSCDLATVFIDVSVESVRRHGVRVGREELKSLLKGSVFIIVFAALQNRAAAPLCNVTGRRVRFPSIVLDDATFEYFRNSKHSRRKLFYAKARSIVRAAVSPPAATDSKTAVLCDFKDQCRPHVST